MSPKTVWLNAMAWCILEHVEEDLANLRPCFDADDTWSAMCLCSKQSLPSVRFLFELPDECYKSDAGLPLGLLSLAMIDFTIAKAMAAVKEGLAYGPFIQNTLDTLEPLSKFFIELPKTVKEGMLSTSLATKMGETPRARADLRAAWFISLFSLISTTDITRTSPRYLFNFDQLQPFLKGNRHFEHDHKLVRDLVTDPDVSDAHSFGLVSSDNDAADAFQVGEECYSPPRYCSTYIHRLDGPTAVPRAHS